MAGDWSTATPICESDSPKSGLEDIGIYSPLRPGVKVYLNVPGQGREGFTFDPEIQVLPGFGGTNLVLARPRFTPDPGVTSTLGTGTSGYLQVNERGELFAPGGIPYNPASPDFGGAYVLSTREGVVYRIDGIDGKLQSATAPNGVSVFFTDESISRSEGDAELTFLRDASSRIVGIENNLGNRTALRLQRERECWEVTRMRRATLPRSPTPNRIQAT